MAEQPHSEIQQQIIQTLKVQPRIDPAEEIGRRTDFLRGHMQASGLHTLVLGISGGVDSTVGGKLAQRAAEEARKRGLNARFVAMRLPYGEQKDEADAQRALEFIAPDEVLTVNIKPAAAAMLAALEQGGLGFNDAAHRDFVMGNIKARQRMIAQYAVAGTRGGLVVGTDHAAEALMGFFTKYGDGACDLTPLTGLNKRQVRALARQMGAPDALVDKQPTADLEDLSPGKADEVAFGIRYEEIDDFLEGGKVSDKTLEIIISAYRKTDHKRNLPFEPGH